jgi:hypothetical protein
MGYALVTALFQSTAALLPLGNAVNEAYATENPQYGAHEPFTLDSQEKFGTTIVAIFAADAAAQVIAVRYNAGDAPPKFENYLRALDYLARGGLANESDAVKYQVRLYANVAWRSCQAFRADKVPFGRLTRGVNCSFATLPPEELAKDDGQIQAAAKALLGHLKRELAAHQAAA